MLSSAWLSYSLLSHHLSKFVLLCIDHLFHNRQSVWARAILHFPAINFCNLKISSSCRLRNESCAYHLMFLAQFFISWKILLQSRYRSLLTEKELWEISRRIIPLDRSPSEYHPEGSFESEFESTCRNLRAFDVASMLGSSPTSSLFESCKLKRDWDEPICNGISPVKALYDRSRDSRCWSSPMLGGIFPAQMFSTTHCYLHHTSTDPLVLYYCVLM